MSIIDKNDRDEEFLNVGERAVVLEEGEEEKQTDTRENGKRIVEKWSTSNGQLGPSETL